ncbi:uncharacterized protein LOC117282672 [Cryptotermes secundus]|uniref:uncharacterized protein LOC117282672 n=1 Tax=Cryptotermes secundus TaxID=105785 RepID=UPI001454E397|nr:uncharacterized protein LOC117282672 [Cryptotermes secundus]
MSGRWLVMVSLFFLSSIQPHELNHLKRRASSTLTSASDAGKQFCVLSFLWHSGIYIFQNMGMFWMYCLQHLLSFYSNSSVNRAQHATAENAVLSVDPTDSPIDCWITIT